MEEVIWWSRGGRVEEEGFFHHGKDGAAGYGHRRNVETERKEKKRLGSGDREGLFWRCRRPKC